MKIMQPDQKFQSSRMELVTTLIKLTVLITYQIYANYDFNKEEKSQSKVQCIICNVPRMFNIDKIYFKKIQMLICDYLYHCDSCL